MALGDMTPIKLLQKALDTTTTGSVITGATDIRTTVTSITLNNTGATKRSVTMYLYGTGASNAILSIPLDPAGQFCQVLTGLDYILQPTEIMVFKQDVGTDVNIATMGIQEALV
jgi:hypothetical protein